MRSFRRLSLSAVAAVSLLLTACNPAAKTTAPSVAPSGTFSKSVSGELKTSGFNPSDDVGKARSEYAKGKIAPATVSMDTANFDTQKFAAQAQSGSVPDLIQADRASIDTLADKGLIMPLDECYAAWGVKPTERYYPAAVSDVTYQGKVYGVPQFFQTAMIIGNQRVMDAAGVAAADLDSSKPDSLIAAAKKMYQANGGNPSVLGFDGDLPGSASTWLAVFGGRSNDANGKPTLDDPNNVAALTWMKQLMDAQGGYAKVKSFKDSMDVFGDKNPYVKDQVGAQTWAQWYINVLGNTKDAVKPVGIPLKDASGKTLGMAGGSALAIPRAAKNPSAACAFAVQVTSPEAWQASGQARATTVAGKNALNTGLFTGSPVADQAIRSAFVKPSGNAAFDQLIDASYQTLTSTTSTGGSAVGADITDALKNAVTVALTGEKSPQAALQDAQATALRAWQQSTVGKNG